jgi:anti-sigma B factor antagonist
MTYAMRVENDAVVLDVRGELDAACVDEIREVVDRLATAGHRSVIVDMSGLSVIDSSGVGSIVSLYKRVRGNGGTVQVRGAKDQPLAILRLLKLDRVLVPEAEQQVAA